MYVHVFCIGSACDETDRNDSLVTGHTSLPTPMVTGTTFDSPGKDPKGTNGQNRQTNNDVDFGWLTSCLIYN